MSDENENEPPQRTVADSRPSDLPDVLRPLAEQQLISAPLLMEAVQGFTLTGAMVEVKCGRRALAPRRLSHFAPDMLTRLAHELGAAGLMEGEISEGKLPTRGFAFFLGADTVAEFGPATPEPEKPRDVEFPDTEIGRAMQMMKMQTEALLSPIMAQMQLMQRSVNAALEAKNAATERGMAMADLMQELQLAQVKKTLLAQAQTPEEALEANLGAFDRIVANAGKVEKTLAKHAPKGDSEADTLDKLVALAENPNVRAIGRGFLRVLGGNVGAPVDAVPVTVEAQVASKLPDLFSVVPKDSA